MATPDWTQAPEGATHYCAVDTMPYRWHKVDKEDRVYFWEDGRWAEYKLHPAKGRERISRAIHRPEAEDQVRSTTTVPSKYHRQIKGVWLDIYDILTAYGVTNPADAHAIKKMLMPGQRGAKDAIKDRREAIASLERAIELEVGE